MANWGWKGRLFDFNKFRIIPNLAENAEIMILNRFVGQCRSITDKYIEAGTNVFYITRQTGVRARDPSDYIKSFILFNNETASNLNIWKTAKY